MSISCTPTPSTEIYPLSLHDALPISILFVSIARDEAEGITLYDRQHHVNEELSGERSLSGTLFDSRSEEHTSELQSRLHLVCRLLLEKKKIKELQVRRKKKYVVEKEV